MLKYPLKVTIVVVVVAALFTLAGIAYAADKQAKATNIEPWSIEKADPLDNIDCAKMIAMGLEKQENLRASRIRVHCGMEAAGGEIEKDSPTPIDVLLQSLMTPWAIGGVDVDTITGTTDPYPSVTQGESMSWGNGNTILVTINTSPSATCAGGSYGHASYSTDGGVTFTRLCPNPFATGHGQNYGDPMGVYNAKLGKWYAVFLAVGCGGQGMGVWESPDAINWTTGACAHSGSMDDRESLWVDNNPASPYYGRMYVSWNDFASGQYIYVVRSDDGIIWTSSQVTTTFIRNVQITGSPGTDGTVFVAGMNEGTGGADNRINLIYRSTNGGVTWTTVYTGAALVDR